MQCQFLVSLNGTSVSPDGEGRGGLARAEDGGGQRLVSQGVQMEYFVPGGREDSYFNVSDLPDSPEYSRRTHSSEICFKMLASKVAKKTILPIRSRVVPTLSYLLKRLILPYPIGFEITSTGYGQGFASAAVPR